jgi:hypothetical protein
VRVDHLLKLLFIPRYTHSHIVYSSQREEYLFLLKAYCCCCSLEDGSAATVSPSLPMQIVREPHSTDPVMMQERRKRDEAHMMRIRRE